MHDIKIGTLVSADNAKMVIPQIIKHGFETFSITFWESALEYDLKEFGAEIMQMLEGTNCSISSLSVFGNPLVDTQKGPQTRKSFEKLIDSAKYFNTDLVTGFAGRLIDRPLGESLAKFKEVFTDIAKRGQDESVKIAFENCNMGGTWNTGDWNMAFSSKMWEPMFDAVNYDNIGLQWEPCHQMVQLVDPIPQLRKWVGKIFNVHGKDATIAWDVIKEHGIYSDSEFVWHRTPGFGDSNWTDIISILRMNGYKGSIDIEGFHDPVYKDELEYTGQVHGLNYLKQCRGGEFIPNPAHKEVRI